MYEGKVMGRLKELRKYVDSELNKMENYSLKKRASVNGTGAL
jgi:hypothetical protein